MSKRAKKNIVILGATGSIGDSTLDIISRNPNTFTVFALTGHTNVAKLAQLAKIFTPKYLIISDDSRYLELKNLVDNEKIKILSGNKALIEICQSQEVDMVVAGIVGSAGMQPVLATVESGKDLLLANKEALVLAGELVIKTAKENNANIIPLDSEHNAIYQCLPGDYRCGNTPNFIDKIILTASGGPFWNRDGKTFHAITPDEACAHPNWDMGRKISVDSATLMNKGLEIIEAYWLFNLHIDEIDVHVHPQSIIHSMVCYKDGTVLAQMGEPDMRIPIAHGLGLPDRITSGANLLNLLQNNDLQFFPPDYQKFPCLSLANQAISQGGTAMAILNAVNEVTVEAFLLNQISFTAIASINENIMTNATVQQVESVAQLLKIDEETRANAWQMVKTYD